MLLHETDIGQVVLRKYSAMDRVISACVALAIVTSYTIFLVETAQTFPQIQPVLSIICPIGSMMALFSPMLACIAYLRGNDSIQLQWRLYLGFGLTSLLGVVYGHRTGIHAILVSAMFGFAVQMVSLIIVCTKTVEIRNWLDFFTAYLIPSLPNPAMTYFLRGFTMIGALLTIALMFSSVLVSLLISVPLQGVLGPLYAISCLFPFIGMMMTFATDTINFRVARFAPEYMYLVSGVVCTKTVGMIFVNCTLWTLYGTVLEDKVVAISSIAGVIITLFQGLCLFATPVVISRTVVIPIVGNLFHRDDLPSKIRSVTAIKRRSDPSTTVSSDTCKHNEAVQGLQYSISRECIVIDFISLLDPRGHYIPAMSNG